MKDSGPAWAEHPSERPLWRRSDSRLDRSAERDRVRVDLDELHVREGIDDVPLRERYRASSLIVLIRIACGLEGDACCNATAAAYSSPSGSTATALLSVPFRIPSDYKTQGGRMMREVAKYPATIELRHLRYFVASAEHGSFRKAGAGLGLSQSTVSRCIADLENQIGASMFHRHTWGISLTFAGQRFLRRARQIIRSVGDGTEDIAAIGRSEVGRVRIGIFSSIASGFLADLLRAYHRRHENVDIELVDGNPEEHVASIRQLGLDVAFLTGTRKWTDCDTERFWSERVFVVLPDDHSLAERTELAWSDVAGETFIVNDVPPGQEIHDYLIQRLAGLGRHPEIRVQYVGRENLLPFVAIGRGLTVVSEAMTAAQFPGIRYRPIIGEILPFSATWCPRNDNPALRRLLSLARSMSKSSASKVG